jgi:beta-glucosidase
VLVNGRPLGIPRVVERAAAVLEAWEPGAFGGQAVAEILFGQVNPSGRLPISVPYSAGQIQTVYNHKPSHYYRHYVFEKTGPLFPFGYGLSYTSFEYDTVRLAPVEIDRNGSVRVEVDLRNSGERAGEEVVQLYLRGRISRVTRPVLELKAFRRVPLKPGQSRTVVFELEAEQLASYDVDMVKGVQPGKYRVFVGPSSRTGDLLYADFEVR